MKLYKRKDNTPIVAVQLNLETDGLEYVKWGNKQKAKQNDWIVNNQGEVYSIDNESFKQTYSFIYPGLYEKKAVWAEEATEDGRLKTKEGYTDYKAGDMILYNNSDKTDGYATSKEKFNQLYEEV